MKRITILFPLLILSIALLGQKSNINWSLVLDGYNDVYLADIAVDSGGNTFAAINYTTQLTISILEKKLPPSPYLSGLLLKINDKGQPVWAHPFKSDYCNRITDLALAPNGDVLITGSGDGLLCFPGKRDTLKAGRAPTKERFHKTSFQGLYAARYTPDGDRKWVQYWSSAGEGTSIAANKQDEVYMTFCNRGSIRQNEVLIDSFKYDAKIEARISFAKFNANGSLQRIQHLGYGQSMGTIDQSITFDNEDNLLIYGTFRGKIKFSDVDSLTNDSYYESEDSYLAKYDADDHFLWSKKIGGQNTQRIADITIAPDNSIYATGRYDWECIFGDNISVIQKSKYEYKSGGSLFYLHLFEHGELDFICFEEGNGYNSYIVGSALAIDPNGKVHLTGYFNDTLRISGQDMITSPSYHGFYSIWNDQSMELLEKIGEASSFMFASHFDINQGIFAVGGEYYGDGAFLRVKNKRVSLSNNDHGRVAYIYGGKFKDDNRDPKTKPANYVSVKNRRIEKIGSMLACTKSDENPAADNWFSKADSSLQADASTSLQPCGETIKGMEALLFPNPTSAELNIKLIGLNGQVQVDIFSASGDLILSQRLEGVLNEQTITFDLTRLSSGNYFVRIGHGNYEKSLRFIKLN